MKRLVEIDNDSFLESLMGQRITVFCARYIYTGDLIAISNDEILLKHPAIVYETGSFGSKDWKDAQQLPHDQFCIDRRSVESYGIMK